ncbi:hypothetical protein BO83DRAFT_402768 [Aspergillus eucalypticola CBS 122712]|uniref:Uncharacterized protein n=1 Tax=Aspergillus eucalypticola (strain CBS 122712 / IBT 29274) TaxID=1448314 RepID=A0A317UPM4_ASPEC|nr:uncharacterized protein BO83DRAFT_402768 [Aspergillus eucalypticola CBS 122712]PWY63953.1 hypothetical protein BO83DRAFT_402768 [Aspergillus eucalypticola CBS 122712]
MAVGILFLQTKNPQWAFHCLFGEISLTQRPHGSIASGDLLTGLSVYGVDQAQCGLPIIGRMLSADPFYVIIFLMNPGLLSELCLTLGEWRESRLRAPGSSSFAVDAARCSCHYHLIRSRIRTQCNASEGKGERWKIQGGTGAVRRKQGSVILSRAFTQREPGTLRLCMERLRSPTRWEELLSTIPLFQKRLMHAYFLNAASAQRSDLWRSGSAEGQCDASLGLGPRNAAAAAEAAAEARRLPFTCVVVAEGIPILSKRINPRAKGFGIWELAAAFAGMGPLDRDRGWQQQQKQQLLVAPVRPPRTNPSKNTRLKNGYRIGRQPPKASV